MGPETLAVEAVGVRPGLLRRWLWWLRDGLQSSLAWRRSKAALRAAGGREDSLEAGRTAAAQNGQDGQRAERILQQSLAGQLSAYPGQGSGGPSTRAGSGQAAGQQSGQLQAGNPRALFPTLFGNPPVTPPPQQLLQVSNNVDGSQQRSSSSTPLQSVDSASSFSALDVGGSPPAITSPSVTIVNNSPCEPSCLLRSLHIHHDITLYKISLRCLCLHIGLMGNACCPSNAIVNVAECVYQGTPSKHISACKAHCNICW